jgi:outer membrane protein OmpA-like peptidoglycan-associated protein
MITSVRAAVARVLCALATVTLLMPSPAGAEKAPYWLVPGGGYVWLPNEFLVKPSRPQYGLILGARMSSHLAAEAHGTYFKSPSTQDSVPTLGMVHLEGSLTMFLAGDAAISPFLTAGAGVAYLHSEGAPSSLHRFDYAGGLGFRFRLGEKVSLRIQGRDVRYKMFIPAKGKDLYRNQPEVFAGISFGIGGPARDKDRDGVPDEDDRCAGTPVGARVDAVGCAIDSDDDGVFDGIDQCNNTPPGSTVNAQGCEMDSDSDGIMDGVDQCPGTPAGATVDASGCPRDADQDSIYDGIDQCPATPPGCIVSSNGCPTDLDQDGICDGLDRCPDTPANAKVDRVGCPITVNDKETQLLETGMIRLQGINFATGKSTILPESESVLDEVGNILARWSELRIEIGGHTDSQGSAAKNQQLSKARATAVLEYLMFKFPELNPGQFTAVGFGASHPIATNSTQLGRSKNRRVEFKVLNKEALKREKTEQRTVPRD